MSVDKQGKNSGETAPNKGNQRPVENSSSSQSSKLDSAADRQREATKKQAEDVLKKNKKHI